ncbi:MAG: SAM-dependent methyltransferase [Rubellimicrobium sp.]|nr:SAM-dependent methyltransferase [Rubellimicrobium sp.]
MPATTPPRLADRAALQRNRTRAARAPVTFLREAVIADIQERLGEVNRTFTAPAVVTPFPELWADVLPGAVTVPDDETLALAPGAHDLLIHDLCLHWADDPVGQLVQAGLALKPDGLLIATLFGGLTLQELRTSLAEAEARVTGGLSPRVAPMGEIRTLGTLLQRADLALPVADNIIWTVDYPSPVALMHDLRGMGEGNALIHRLRRPTARGVIEAAIETYVNHFGANGRVPATFEVAVLTGWTRHPDQQQPLRPGSAVARLADALGVNETKLDPGP